MMVAWPFVGMPLMVVLGLGVRDGATPVDAWLQQARGGPLEWLTLFTGAATSQAVLLAAVVVALYRRRWALIPVIVVLPLVAVWASGALKPLFGRFKEGALAYPSGHTTAMVVVIGVLVLAIGARRWLLWAAAVFVTLGVLGQSVSYHYLTDAVGALLLGTSLVCGAAAPLRRIPRLI